jgi:DNA-binding transcriptional MerR regulator
MVLPVDGQPGLWTLDQLTEQVGSALASGYDGAPSGRVRSVPDQRAIRWYATIGLVDRPAAMRGRTALYGERHLLQLVAIKRRQAAGRSLAEIQAELTGATDTTLRAIAQLPDSTPVPAKPAPTPRPDRFWTATTTRATTTRATATHTPTSGPASPAAVAAAVVLPGGVTLVLPAGVELGAGDVDAIRAAAGPLLAELTRLGLTETAHQEGTK